nr:SRPBCC domain-containing protein [uncultured Mucilaginibacter sp.]
MDYIVKKSINIKAEPAEVWDALTNPQKTQKYFFKCRVISDWKEGSKITFKGKMFWIIPIKLTGKILAVEPGKLLQYSLRNASDKEGKTTSTVTDKLTYQNGETTLFVTDDVGEGEDAEKRYKRSENGWDKVLRGLKKLVEKGG